MKYILHGGQTRIECENNANFFGEFLKVDHEPIKILLCYFARSQDRWIESASEDMNRIQILDKTKKIEFMIADIDDFINKIDWADVIYLRGGDGHLIRDNIKRAVIKYGPEISEDNSIGAFLSDCFKDKIVIGSSAGVNVLAKYYYDQDQEDMFEEGFGVLPIKTIAHFGEGSSYPADYKTVAEQLKKFMEDLELILIPETEYIIIEK